MKAKRFVAVLAALALILVVASPALAASFGVSPSHTELVVPGDGSSTANFQIHFFSGDVEVSLVDIPLRVEPETIHVEALNKPADIELTIYGDETLGSQVYDGYIRFIGMSGGSVAAGVEVKAKITNVSEGIPVPPQAEKPAAQEPEPVAEKPTPEVAPTPSVAEETSPQSPQAPPPAPVQPGAKLPLIPVLIGFGVVIVLLLLVIARIVIRRRT